MDRGDVYLVSLDPTSGHEQQGTRPVLIVSPSAFNRLTKTPVVLPITSGGNLGFSRHTCKNDSQSLTSPFKSWG
ncbi:type II toxin-antitoxin system PemK/MazF family toxin [Xanthomonas euvesicatoria]